MSKGIEEMPDKKINLSAMSERQALLYFQHGGGNEDLTKEKPNTLIDYHQYFNHRKDKAHTHFDKTKAAERSKNTKLALKEFTSITKNIYIDRKKYVFTDDDAYICACIPRKYTQTEAKEVVEGNYANKTEEELFGCGRKCINKMVYWECVEHLCPCGASCRNRKFQNHEYADVYPIKTEDRGFGLCAGSLLPKGSFVIQYIGEVFSKDSDFGVKKLAEYKSKKCTYLMSLSKNEVIDPTSKGNFARFINHSCDPNCETQKWHVLGEVCIGIFTLRDIQPDEELTFDYGFDILKTTFQKCLCGADSCRGYLGIVSTDSPNSINSITCEACKSHCKQSEPILICDDCRKIFHKKCAKKGRGNNRNYTCYHCLKKVIGKKAEVKVVKVEEEPIYDDYYEVGDEEIGRIRKNLPELINCGARLFWDFQMQNAILGTSNKLDIKITGTSSQIDNVKKMITHIKELKSDLSSSFTVKLQIPKVFVRKIIGHQNRNLDAYKSKFNVEIDYDASLITDDIFPIQDYSYMQVKGKENNVKAVENDIKSYLFNLRVLSIYLMPPDYSFIRGNICNLKTIIDPADVRLRRRDYKTEKDLKHPFYYIANNNRDIVIIGFEREVEKAEKIIKDFILRQNTLVHNYSLSFLYPIYFRKQLTAFITENKNQFTEKEIYADIIEPEFLRRHLSVYLEGKWKDITEIKSALWRFLKESPDEGTVGQNGKRHSIGEFEQYAFNQEHKLISKCIKNGLIDANCQIKNWDYISVDVLDLSNEKSAKDSAIGMSSTFQKRQERCSLLSRFPTTCDRDTKLNYLVNYHPGSYKTMFNQSQNEVASNLLSLVTEAYDSYKESKLRALSNLALDSKKTQSGKPQGEEKSFAGINEPEIRSKHDLGHNRLLEELRGVSQETDLKHISSSVSLNLKNDSVLAYLPEKDSLIPAGSPPSIGKDKKEGKDNQRDRAIQKQVKREESIEKTRKRQKEDKEKAQQFPEKIILEPRIDISRHLNQKKSNSDEERSRRKRQKEGTAPNGNEALRFSYSFPTIQQMNININISELNILNKADQSIEPNTNNIPDYFQRRELLQEKLLSALPNQVSSVMNMGNSNEFDMNSMYLQRKKRRSPSIHKKSTYKRSLKHDHHYHAPKDPQGFHDSTYPNKNRIESPLRHIKREHSYLRSDSQTTSRSPSMTSFHNCNQGSQPNKYQHQYKDYSSNHTVNFNSRVHSSNGRYPYGNNEPFQSKIQYDISNEYDKQYYPQGSFKKLKGNHHRRDNEKDRNETKMANNKNERHICRDRDSERERIKRRGRDKLPETSNYDNPNYLSNQRQLSRSRSRSPGRKYGNYYTFRRSTPEYTNHTIAKPTEQKAPISTFKEFLNNTKQCYYPLSKD